MPPRPGTLHDTLLNESLLLPASRDICRARYDIRHFFNQKLRFSENPKMPPIFQESIRTPRSANRSAPTARNDMVRIRITNSRFFSRPPRYLHPVLNPFFSLFPPKKVSVGGILHPPKKHVSLHLARGYGPDSRPGPRDRVLTRARGPSGLVLILGLLAYHDPRTPTNPNPNPNPSKIY